jgi:hypothetical protein
MKNLKDLNWLSAPAFFLILGMIALNAKKQTRHKNQSEKVRMENAAPSAYKQP